MMRCGSRLFREGSRYRSRNRESEKEGHKRDQLLKPLEVGHDYADPSLQHTAAINCGRVAGFLYLQFLVCTYLYL